MPAPGWRDRDEDAGIKALAYLGTHIRKLAHSNERRTYIYAFVSGLLDHHDLISIPSAFISLQATLFGFLPPSFFSNLI